MEPVLLIVLLGSIFAALTVRLTLGRNASMGAALDCRLGYYGLLSFATSMRPAVAQENARWIAVNVRDGHFLFSKRAIPAHPMVVRRRIETTGDHFRVLTEGCAFGEKEAYKVAMTQLPPAVKEIHQENGRVSIQLKADLEQ